MRFPQHCPMSSCFFDCQFYHKALSKRVLSRTLMKLSILSFVSFACLLRSSARSKYLPSWSLSFSKAWALYQDSQLFTRIALKVEGRDTGCQKGPPIQGIENREEESPMEKTDAISAVGAIDSVDFGKRFPIQGKTYFSVLYVVSLAGEQESTLSSTRTPSEGNSISRVSIALGLGLGTREKRMFKAFSGLESSSCCC